MPRGISNKKRIETAEQAMSEIEASLLRKRKRVIRMLRDSLDEHELFVSILRAFPSQFE